jgi:hypothetical protein
MKRNRALFCMLALTVADLPAWSADGAQPDVAGASTQALVYFGTHGNAIFAARLDESSGRLTALGQAVAIERPTWLITSPHAPVIYSVGETGNDGRSEGRVYSLSIDTTNGKLQTITWIRARTRCWLRISAAARSVQYPFRKAAASKLSPRFRPTTARGLTRGKRVPMPTGSPSIPADISSWSPTWGPTGSSSIDSILPPAA